MESGENYPLREILVELLPPGEEQGWDDYVRQHPGATVYHLCGWGRVVREAYGHQAYYLLARAVEDPSGRILGVLPLICLRHFLFGTRLVSVPFFDKGGVLADEPRIADILIRRAIELGHQLGAGVIELRHERPLVKIGRERLPVSLRAHKVGMELELPGSADELWQSFKAKLRSQIKKPLKEGLTVRVGGSELLPPFYRVFAVNMRDLGSPVHSRAMPEAVLRVFGEKAAIIMIFREKQPLAGGLVVGGGPVLANPWSSALRRYSELSPNMLLYWAMLDFGCRHGYGRFDFGRSTPGGGTYRFKKQWGAGERPLAWESIHLRPGGNGEGRADSRRRRAAVQCWRKMPVSWSKVLGPLIRKHIDL